MPTGAGLVHDYAGGLDREANIRLPVMLPSGSRRTTRILRFFRLPITVVAGRMPRASRVLSPRRRSERFRSGLAGDGAKLADPFRVLLDATGVLNSVVLPETEKWGIDAVP